MGKTVNKKIYKFEDVKEKIIEAVDLLVDPIRGTISPKGANVIFSDDNGNVNHTNDGYTIAKNISVKDPLQDMIINIVREAAVKTNTEAGDGTSTTAILAQVLIKEGLKKISDGWNKMELQEELQASSDKIVKKLKAQKKEIKDDKDLEYIATIAANNDKTIAKDVVTVAKKVGKRGLVFIEPNTRLGTDIKIESGLIMKAGLFSHELKTGQQLSVVYQNVPVLVTDKRLYYHEEAETIIKTVRNAGHDSVVVVAKDFVGEALATLIANHTSHVLNILLVKEPHSIPEYLEDIAIYLGTEVVSDKKGMLVDKIRIENFGIASKVMSDRTKTIFTPNQKALASPELSMRINELQKIADEDPENSEIEERLASLSDGMVTIKVGGSTPIEVNERIYRYEDSVNATRSAMEHGYLVGGGLALLNTFKEGDHHPDLVNVFRKFCEAPSRQILDNCGESYRKVEGSKNLGYNANTGELEDLIKSGVIDPYKVTEMAVKNSISVARSIISSNYLIVNDYGDKKEGDGGSKSEN